MGSQGRQLKKTGMLDDSLRKVYEGNHFSVHIKMCWKVNHSNSMLIQCNPNPSLPWPLLLRFQDQASFQMTA